MPITIYHLQHTARFVNARDRLPAGLNGADEVFDQPLVVRFVSVQT